MLKEHTEQSSMPYRPAYTRTLSYNKQYLAFFQVHACSMSVLQFN